MSTTDSNSEYEVVDVGDDRYQVIRFIGAFQGQDVTWLAYLHALGSDQSSYLDVGEHTPQGLEIEIGLPLDQIDRPTILKAIIMVRQYKDLGPGRHEFGGNN